MHWSFSCAASNRNARLSIKTHLSQMASVSLSLSRSLNLVATWKKKRKSFNNDCSMCTIILTEMIRTEASAPLGKLGLTMTDKCLIENRNLKRWHLDDGKERERKFFFSRCTSSTHLSVSEECPLLLLIKCRTKGNSISSCCFALIKRLDDMNHSRWWMDKHADRLWRCESRWQNFQLEKSMVDFFACWLLFEQTSDFSCVWRNKAGMALVATS